MITLKKGDAAPGFSVPDESGKLRTLEEFRGQKLAIYFYPRDLTPTCTEQACNIRDNYSLLESHGIKIVGVSEDDSKSHVKFINKHNLPFTLLADTDHTMLNAYGVWGPKKFMGKEYDGIHRTTFLLDEEGTIVEIIEKIKAKDHAKQIIDAYS